MFLFNMEEVYIGYSLEELSKIINILTENNIKYKYKVVKRLRNDERFSLRKAGVNMNYETQHTVSVSQSEYDNAKYLVYKVLHS